MIMLQVLFENRAAILSAVPNFSSLTSLPLVFQLPRSTAWVSEEGCPHVL